MPRSARRPPRLDHRYPSTLREGILVRRYQRFLADVRDATGRVLTVHCANPGSMRTCAEPGRPVRWSLSDVPTRRLPGTLEQIRMGNTWVGLNTMVPNRAVAAAIRRGGVPGLSPEALLESEVRVPGDGRSRIDFRHGAPERPCWVEVKNTSMRVGREARFPDSVTERGRKHLFALAERRDAGDRAVLLFFVHRSDVDVVRPAWEIDATYARTLSDVVERGVEVVAVRARVTREGVRVDRSLPVELAPGAIV